MDEVTEGPACERLATAQLSEEIKTISNQYNK